jgi:hypothetical protein
MRRTKWVRLSNGSTNRILFTLAFMILSGISCSTRTQNRKDRNRNLNELNERQSPRDTNENEKDVQSKKKELDSHGQGQGQVFDEESAFGDQKIDDPNLQHQNKGGKIEAISGKKAAEDAKKVKDKTKKIPPSPWRKPTKDEFPEAPFDFKEVDVVLNVVGGSGGYGDFTGPFFIFLEMMQNDLKREKKFLSWNRFAVVIEDYT